MLINFTYAPGFILKEGAEGRNLIAAKLRELLWLQGYQGLRIHHMDVQTELVAEGVTEADPVRVDSLLTGYFEDWFMHKDSHLAEGIKGGGTSWRRRHMGESRRSRRER